MKTTVIAIVFLGFTAIAYDALESKPDRPSAFLDATIGQVTVHGYAVPCDRVMCELAAARICSDGRTFPDGTPIVGATWEQSRGMICAARCSDPMNTLVVMNCSNNYSADWAQECRTALAQESGLPDVFAASDAWSMPPECRLPKGIQEGPESWPGSGIVDDPEPFTETP